nr:uncharacterized protein LOC112734266 [Arachis hypogaea]
MGFGQKWRAWVMECVTTASMSVLINGSPSKPFKMERGLRQGDPLSPFLFVLVVEVLHRMIGEAVRNGRISPLLVGRDSIELSHLQFADDTILFCPPEDETIRNHRRLLRCFELMSGLTINFDKSSFIPINCDEQWAQCMCNLLGCANPRLVKTWKPIIDKVEEKLSLWKAKVLNKAEKLVLIKSVLNSLPVYYLSLFKMAKAVAEKLISLQRRFLWCKEDGRNGMALVRWEVVQAPKKLGGLGMGDAVIRNIALLFKWWWRFAKEECPLWKKVVCSCHNLNSNELLSTQVLPTKGGPWKDICQVNITNQQLRDKMVTGLSMEVWQEKVLPEEITSFIFTRSIWKGLVWNAWISAFGRLWTFLGSLKEHFLSWTEETRSKENQRQRLRYFLNFNLPNLPKILANIGIGIPCRYHPPPPHEELERFHHCRRRRRTFHLKAPETHVQAQIILVIDKSRKIGTSAKDLIINTVQWRTTFQKMDTRLPILKPGKKSNIMMNEH